VFNNPNAFGLQVKDADLKIFINDTYIADAAQPTGINIGANSNFRLPVQANFEVAKILGQALNVLSSRSVNWRINGSIRVGKADLFVRIPVSVSDVYRF
jgi:LEA14-like dessication related protein